MVHGDGRLTGPDGLELYYQFWFPATSIQGVVGIIHGLGSHSGLFPTVVRGLVAAGYGVYGLDLRGHGQSPGQRGYIQRWSELTGDGRCFWRLMTTNHPDTPCFLLGHSLGAVIVLDLALQANLLPAGVIAMAPAIGPVGISPLKLGLGRLLSWVWPRFTLDTGIPEGAGSHDPVIMAIYANDPLRHTKGTARLVTEFLGATQRLRSQLSRLRVPVLLLQGSADPVALPQGSRQLWEQLTMADKEYREYPGGLHDLHNDSCAEVMTLDLVHWLNRHHSHPLICDLSQRGHDPES